MAGYNVYKSGPRKGEPKTLRDRVVRYLIENLRCVEVECRSGKYAQFNLPTEGSAPIFVGSKGAVRRGSCASKSVSISHKVHPAVEAWEKKLVDSGK